MSILNKSKILVRILSAILLNFTEEATGAPSYNLLNAPKAFFASQYQAMSPLPLSPTVCASGTFETENCRTTLLKIGGYSVELLNLLENSNEAKLLKNRYSNELKGLIHQLLQHYGPRVENMDDWCFRTIASTKLDKVQSHFTSIAECLASEKYPLYGRIDENSTIALALESNINNELTLLVSLNPGISHTVFDIENIGCDPRFEDGPSATIIAKIFLGRGSRLVSVFPSLILLKND